jgi:hypothetical protein
VRQYGSEFTLVDPATAQLVTQVPLPPRSSCLSLAPAGPSGSAAASTASELFLIGCGGELLALDPRGGVAHRSRIAAEGRVLGLASLNSRIASVGEDRLLKITVFISSTVS